ncbi:MAG: hypothetical protein E7B34_12365 [Hafnia alvei]|nr:hypothetical protein [Hafnia alvei]
MKDILLMIRENLQMGYTLSFIEAQLLRQAIDVIVILDENSPVIPDGWKLVPIEPTAEMYEAGDKQITTKQVWDSMLAAAPAQESE